MKFNKEIKKWWNERQLNRNREIKKKKYKNNYRGEDTKIKTKEKKRIKTQHVLK